MKRPGSPDEIDEAATAVRPSGPRESKRSAFVLVVVEGDDQGARFRVDDNEPSPLLVGQGPACHVRLTDRQASRRHAAVELDAGRVRVRDLGSTNGTLIEGVAVVDAFLAPGETMRVGETSLRLER